MILSWQVSRNFLTINYTTKGKVNPMKQTKVRRMVTCAMLAAIYTAVSFVLAPISYGFVQIRVAEAMTLLPVFAPSAVFGVTLGCFVTNLIGFMTGANILGWLDIVFGTAATLIAAWMTWFLRDVRIKGLPVLAAIPPVLMNAVVIGLELCWLISGGFNWAVFLLNAISVGVGQIVSCFLLGLPLVWWLEKTGLHRRMFSQRNVDPDENR